MKKILILTLALLMLLGTLAACNTPSPDLPEEQTTLQEAPVPVIPPEQVVEALAPNATVMQTGLATKQVILPTDDIEAAAKAFSDAGYASVSAALVTGAKIETRVMFADDVLITLQKTESALYVIWEGFEKDLLSLLSPNPATGTGSVTLAQIGVEREQESDNPMIGMCYIYKLSDGSAVIIDGGMPTDSCASNVYNTLKKLDIAKDEQGRYRITAWIISHGHKDHRGTLNRFGKLYKDQSTLKYFMYNFPLGELSTSDFDVPGYVEKIQNHYPDAKQIYPHAGLQYHLDNLTLQILYSPEMIYAPDQQIAYYNDSCLIVMAECNGTRVLHMGDAGEIAATAAWAAYKEHAFKADALQITHHGLYTGSESHIWKNIKKIYNATDATIGLLPMGSRKPNDSRNGRHTVLIGWGGANYQVSYIVNKKDNHGTGNSSGQEYYNQFVANVAAGTSEFKTLWGYDGINTVDNGKGLLTYLSCNENAPMVTLITLSKDGARVESNQALYDWLN